MNAGQDDCGSNIYPSYEDAILDRNRGKHVCLDSRDDNFNTTFNSTTDLQTIMLFTVRTARGPDPLPSGCPQSRGCQGDTPCQDDGPTEVAPRGGGVV